MQLRLWTLLIVLALLPTISAGTPDEPELVDAAGDGQLYPVPVPPPWAEWADLRAVWFDDDAEALIVTIQVEDLSQVENTDVGVNPDTMFIAWFESDHDGGAAVTAGTWKVRADYSPQNGDAWGYWAEGPCQDGDDSDGCAGGDRHIIDAIGGSHDMQNSTVTLHLPRDALGTPPPGHVLTDLHASTQIVWPSYPVYTVDWDTDQRGSATYTAMWGQQAPGAAGDEPKEADAAGGRNASDGDPAEDGGSEPTGNSSQEAPESDGDGDDTSERFGKPDGDSATVDAADDTASTPGPGALLVTALLGIAWAASRRR